MPPQSRGRSESAKTEDAVDRVGRALVLADVRDAGSLHEIVAAVAALGSRMGGRSATDPAYVDFLDAAKRLAEGGSVDALADLEALGARFSALQRLAETSAVAEPEAMPLAADEELLADFVSRANEHLETADESLLLLEKDPAAVETLNALFRVFHTIKGMAGFLGLSEIESLAHQAEGVLDGPRSGQGALDKSGFDVVFATIDALKSEVASVGSPLPVTESGEPNADGCVTPSPALTNPAPAATNSVRVDEERLDRLLDTIGELVIAESMFSESIRGRSDAFNPLTAQLARLDKITRELQEMATSLRMVPLKATFVRVARLVRDLASKSGKSVELVVSGEDTELDKLVVDRIYDPLVHIIRNAVDHGIESADERRVAGKPAAGRIELTARHGGGGIHISIRDDGRGLDLHAVVEKARERGLLAADDAPSERGAVDLVFEPGLSTAREVTDVSGRGVGMDVVRRVVDSLRGQVEIVTEAGQGTLISIRLPLTLAIIDGMVVRVGSERYIVPTLSIERSLRPVSDQISGVLGKGTVLELDGDLMPLVQLGKLFDESEAEQDPTQGIVVIVGSNGDRVGLVAREIIGQQQIVIKSLGDSMQRITGVAGGAVMPDGRVGLIVDVGGLVQLARS